MTTASGRNDGRHAVALRSQVAGSVLSSEDAEYDQARSLFYAWHDRRPAAIVRVSGAKDVAATIRYAREQRMPLTVRSGGHSGAGHSVCDDGIVIDLSGMKSVDIDVTARTAWAETGLTAGQYLAATSEHGLATGFGDTGTVGIGGITLGGGMGFLSRRFGLTIDELLAAEVVLADGTVVETNDESHPDLFWAVRGGGGNFGVATRFRFRLREVDRVVGGMLFQPATEESILQIVRLAEEGSEDLSMIINIGVMPPMPFLPPEAHGHPVIMTMLVHSGPVSEGQAVVGRLRSVATPWADMVRPLRYREMFEGPEGPHPAAASSRSMFMDRFERQDAEAIVDALQRSTAPMRVAQLRVLGGAVARVPVDATAYAHRNRHMLVNVAALYERRADAPPHDAWVASLSDGLSRGDGSVYVNFLGDEGPHRVHDAYPKPTYDRLASIKKHYDPDNVFHGNHNIVPAPK